MLFGTALRQKGRYSTDAWLDRQSLAVLEVIMRAPMQDLPRRRASLWLIVGGLVALSGSAMVLSVGVLLLVLVAIVTPVVAISIYAAFETRSERLTLRDHERVVPTVPSRRSAQSSGNDVHRWENEGGDRGEGDIELSIDAPQPYGSLEEISHGH